MLVNFKVKSILNKVYSFVCTLGIVLEINERLSRGRVNWNVPSMTKVGSACEHSFKRKLENKNDRK